MTYLACEMRDARCKVQDASTARCKVLQLANSRREDSAWDCDRDPLNGGIIGCSGERERERGN